MNGYLAQQKNLEQAKANVQTALDAIHLAKSQQENIENQIHDLNNSISNKFIILSVLFELLCVLDLYLSSTIHPLVQIYSRFVQPLTK